MPLTEPAIPLNAECHADAFGKVPYSQKPPQGSTPPVVAILNGVGYHTEVYCALLWSFMRAGTLPEVFVLKEATSGIQDVISDWYASHGHVSEAFTFITLSTLTCICILLGCTPC